MEKVLRKLEKILPEGVIDYEWTKINYPHIILNVQKLELTKQQYNELKKLGWKVGIGCIAACGYGYLIKSEKSDKIVFEVYPCNCHPTNYFLTLVPTK